MKIVIKEEQQEKIKLPPFIYKAIVNKNTSIGDSEALPPFGDFGFEYAVTRKGFEEADEIINRYIERGGLESKDVDYLLSVLSKKIERCKKIEKTLAPQLEKLCENIVNSTFSIPTDTIILSCKLVDRVKPKSDIRVMPENEDDGNEYDFEDVDEVMLSNKVILKRRFINSLIQGLSYWLSTDLDDWHDEIYKMNSELEGLWYDIKNISDYLLYTKKDEINSKHPNLLSHVDVKLRKRGKKTEIYSQGVIFPYLLRDTFRGLFELFSAHGLPKDSEKAMYIIKRADFLVAEPWDLRLGKGIIEVIQKSFKKFGTDLLFDTKKIPFFFADLCKLKTDEFNSIIKNFILGTRKGNIIAHDMENKINHDVDYQRFKDKIYRKNIETSVIADGDFSKEELDGYVIQENGMDEMMAYHGTGADFDKFNHKKFLSTGAGSQTFGWGTYATDDKEVANGYSNAVGNCIEQIKPIVEEAVKMYGYNGRFSIDEMCVDINSTFKVYRGDLDNLINFYEERLKNPGSLEHVIDKDYTKILLYVAKRMPKKSAYLYEVDIPEDNGQNYIEWYEEFPSEFMKRILQGFLRLHDNYLNAMAEKNYPFKCDLYQDIQWMKQNPERAYKMIDIISNGDYEDFFSSSFYTNKALTDGKSVYRRLQQIFFGRDKAASLFLMQCGFDGIKYPSGTKWQKPDGASEDAYNYVIFDANKVKIVNKTKV